MRLPAVLLALGLTAAGLAPAPVAASHGCEQTPVYRSCGDHAPELPVRMRVNGSEELRRAAVAASDTWNRLWLAAAPGWIDEENPSCPVICIDPLGASSISIGALPCGDPGAVAVACLTRAGSSGHAYHHITRVTVVLSASRTWRTASGAELVTGEIQGMFQLNDPQGNGSLFCPGSWWDIESALAHELGHALGLDDLPGAWPASFVDAPAARQTMYATGEPCSTNKRTPEEGDLLGLRLAAAESAKHR